MGYWMFIFPLLLLITGLALVILEVFFPSGGILGFLSFCSIVAAVILGFRGSTPMGIGVLLTAIVGVPLVIIVALQWLPDTAVGRKIILHAPSSEDVLPDDQKTRSLKDLVGKVGKAKSKMLPAGVVKIDGRTVDCVSQGMAIEPGSWVRVMEVHGNRVVVRPLDEHEMPEQPRPGDPLAEPIDIDPFGEENESSA